MSLLVLQRGSEVALVVLSGCHPRSGMIVEVPLEMFAIAGARLLGSWISCLGLRESRVRMRVEVHWERLPRHSQEPSLLGSQTIHRLSRLPLEPSMGSRNSRVDPSVRVVNPGKLKDGLITAVMEHRSRAREFHS